MKDWLEDSKWGAQRGVGAGVVIGMAMLYAVLPGCVAQQADLKQTEKALQQRIKQQDDQLSQARARQSQELSVLREQELPILRGELDKALQQAKELQGRQEDLKYRSAQLEQQTKRLEQLATKVELDSNARHVAMQKGLEAQDARVAARLDEVSKAMEALKRDIVDVVQRTNEGLVKRVDAKLDEQHKGVVDNQQRVEQVSQKFTQFNQALTGFREALTGLHDRVSQEEQTTKSLVTRFDTDAKTASTHAADVNKSVASVTKVLEAFGQKVNTRLDEQDRAIESLSGAPKSVETMGQKVNTRLDELDRRIAFLSNAPNRTVEAAGQKSTARLEEQDRRIDALSKMIEGMGQKITARLDDQDHRLESLTKSIGQVPVMTKAVESVGQKVNARLDDQDRRLDVLTKLVEQSAGKSGVMRQAPAPRSSSRSGQMLSQDGVKSEQEPASSASLDEVIAPPSMVTVAPPQESSMPFEPVPGSPDPTDRIRYERVLTQFREGDLEGARLGFATFLSEYPNSDLAPNARFWLGESYFGKKDFQKAIDSYDKVELDYPRSEKVPAAILKKGYAYLALKDKKRASSAFKQVVTLYPRSPEAGKASDKLAQLKEVP